MPITYGKNLAKSSRALKWSGTDLMKAYTTHTEVSDVFLSYRHTDETTAWSLARYLDRRGILVFIDIHDNSLTPGQGDLDDALITAIDNSNTMIIVVSDETQGSWWVPWEVGVSTPSGKAKALYKPQAHRQLPDYLEKLKTLWTPEEADSWVTAFRGVRSRA
ncbi:MAG: toll/interleukin-1 receptor domain-containing protein [Dehalococcoidia bacterium]|nr:toll/interleukin-1 receptor domain-containing protein [Dehalococcoidia bacterium]